MKSRKIVAIFLVLMLVMGSVASVYADGREPVVTVNMRVKVVDENNGPVSGVIMFLQSLSGSGGVSHATTGQDGIATFPVPPGYYCMQELGYEDNHTVYNSLYFYLGPLGDVKEDTHHRENVDFEIETEFGPEMGAIIWPCADYPESYKVSVTLESDDFAGSRVELLTSCGTVIKAWSIKEKGELIADLSPGAYTLREIVEINGYEMPMNSHIMVGSGTLVPLEPHPENIDPEFAPELPELPGYIYDDFQKWIEQLK